MIRMRQLAREKLDSYCKIIHNGNWTEWSAIWSEIIRVISKSNERAAQVRFEITSMISDQNCTTRSSIATLLDPFWNRTIFALNYRFLVYCSSSRFVKKSVTGNAFTSHLVCKTMSCDENAFEHDKETNSSEVRTKIVYLRCKRSILVFWINYGRPSFLLLLRLRLFIFLGEGI